jgi:hypothetical protein
MLIISCLPAFLPAFLPSCLPPYLSPSLPTLHGLIGACLIAW